MIVRLLQNSGETIDFEANRINSIDFTTKSMTINYGIVSNTTAIDDIECLLYMSPALILTTKSMDFGKVEVDYAKTLPVTLTNTGDYPETYTILTDGVFAVKTPYQEMTVMAGQSVTIDLTFMPKDVKAYNSYLVISSNSAENGMLRLPVKGEGVATVAEEEEPYIEPVEQEVEIILAEDEAPESLEGFKVSNFYGEFPVQFNASTRSLGRTRQSGDNQCVCTANVPVSSNGLQFHSFIDGFGNPWMFTITLPNEKPEISFAGTALSLIMMSPEMITSNEAEYRNVISIVKKLDSFKKLVQDVRQLYFDAKEKNMSPAFSTLNITPVINDLYALSKDTRELRLSGISIQDLSTTPLSAKFCLRNDFKRLNHVYMRRVKMNDANLAIVEGEDASYTFTEMLDIILDEFKKDAGKKLNEFFPDEDNEEILGLISEFKEMMALVEKQAMDNYPELGKLFKYRVPYVLKSEDFDYGEALMDRFFDAVDDYTDQFDFDIDWEKSMYEVISQPIEVEFSGYDKILVETYGIGVKDYMLWDRFTKEEQLRIILSLIHGGYYDILKPLIDLGVGLYKANKEFNKNENFNYDFRYGFNKYPEFALVIKLLGAFMSDMDNPLKLRACIVEKDYVGILKLLSEFFWGEITKIPDEVDKFDNKQGTRNSNLTYANLIFSIYQKHGIKIATDQFRSKIKNFLGTMALIEATVNATEKIVDLGGAIYALKNANLKTTHVIDMYNHPHITVKKPTTCYMTHDVNILFEWETYKSNTFGEYLYDLEMMAETPSGVTQTVVLSDIIGNSCEYNLNDLGGARDAMNIYYRIVAHDPAYSQVYVTTDFIPIVLRAKAKAPEMVDLGLPSGTLWALCNLGADTSEDYGSYYAWGESDTKTAFSWKNYKYCSNGQPNALTKYNTKSNYGKVDNKNQIDAADDWMKANCGYFYAIPTKEDWDELKNYCKWTYDVRGGYMVRGNGNIIFLPFAGYRSGLNQYDVGKDGYYWSSTLDQNSPDDAWFMYISPGKHELNSYYRSQGRCIRPVMHKYNYKSPKDVRNAVNSTK